MRGNLGPGTSRGGAPMARFTLLFTLVLAAVLIALPRAAAQEATPVPACSVEPRPEEELIAMNASPSPVAESTALATTPMELPEGDSPDAATLNALDETLQQAVACAESGDIGRLLALYSDAYVANV